MAVCQTAQPAESKTFQKAEHLKGRLSTSLWTLSGGIATEKGSMSENWGVWGQAAQKG